jgi:nicotinate-nucleotide adenylyltransferase
LTPTSRPARIGVFGGTFDPIHRGHVQVADECASALDLDVVLMIPSFRPPHRPQPQASPADRLAMVRLAVEGHPRLQASDIEVNRGGVSYTVDTIRALVAESPSAELTLLLGWDAAREFGEWHDAAEIARLARVAVFNRSGAGAASSGDLAVLGLPADAVYVEVSSPLLSATSVRQILTREGAGEDLLPSAVASFIRDRGIYREK